VSVVTAQPILLYLQKRLRARLVESELVNDPDLLGFLSDAYVDACEQSRCLVALTTLTLTTAQEYDLPADWSETIAVAANGAPIAQVGLRDSQADRGSGAPLVRYTYARKIGFSPVPTGGSALLLYAQTPPRFASWQDTLDARFPLEYAYLLVHYVRWRVAAMNGGAQHISLANFERAMYDQGINRLRQAVLVTDSTGPARVRHINQGVLHAQ
jgi:hypothetical protein